MTATSPWASYVCVCVRACLTFHLAFKHHFKNLHQHRERTLTKVHLGNNLNDHHWTHISHSKHHPQLPAQLIRIRIQFNKLRTPTAPLFLTKHPIPSDRSHISTIMYHLGAFLPLLLVPFPSVAPYFVILFLISMYIRHEPWYDRTSLLYRNLLFHAIVTCGPNYLVF